MAHLAVESNDHVPWEVHHSSNPSMECQWTLKLDSGPLPSGARRIGKASASAPAEWAR